MLKAALPSGSYPAISHITADEVSGDTDRKAREMYGHATASAVPRFPRNGPAMRVDADDLAFRRGDYLFAVHGAMSGMGEAAGGAEQRPTRCRDKIVVVAGSSPGTPGKTNALRVHRVCEAVDHG
jgi:hypothetical protein